MSSISLVNTFLLPRRISSSIFFSLLVPILMHANCIKYVQVQTDRKSREFVNRQMKSLHFDVSTPSPCRCLTSLIVHYPTFYLLLCHFFRLFFYAHCTLFVFVKSKYLFVFFFTQRTSQFLRRLSHLA